MEESMVEDELKDFNYRMLHLKKEISRLYRYYSQLADLGENLYENEKEFFEKKHTGVFRIFAERTTRLQEETQVLREYAMQVQDVYQSEIGIRQNNVMKVLTIVTTVFLPLTLTVFFPQYHHIRSFGHQSLSLHPDKTDHSDYSINRFSSHHSF